MRLTVRLAVWLTASTLLGTGTSHAAPTAKSKSSKASKKNGKSKSKKPPAPKKPPPYPCSAMGWKPILLSSRIARDGDTALVTQDLLVVAQPPDKAAGKPEDARMFVSFGAPGLPLSMRVEFTPLGDGELTAPARASERTRALVYQQAPESDGACTMLGRPNESGVVVQLPRDLAVDPQTNLAVLRIEQQVQVGTVDKDHHDLVLRQSTAGGKPIRLGPIHATEPTRVELCSHGHPSVPVVGSPLFQESLAQQNLCVTLGPTPP